MTPTPDDVVTNVSDDTFLVFSNSELREWDPKSANFNSGPLELPQAEIDELFSGLDDSPDPDARNAPDDGSHPVVSDPDWLVLVRELARKHGPFSAARIIRIVPILMAGPNTVAESN